MEQHSPFPNKKELLAIAGILALALGLFFVFSLNFVGVAHLYFLVAPLV